MQKNPTQTQVISFTAFTAKGELIYSPPEPKEKIISHIKKICSTAILHKISVFENNLCVSNEVINQNLDNC